MMLKLYLTSGKTNLAQTDTDIHVDFCTDRFAKYTLRAGNGVNEVKSQTTMQFYIATVFLPLCN